MEFRKDTDKKKKINIYNYFRDLEKFYGILYMLLLAFILYLGVKYVKTLDYNRIFSAPGLLAADSNMRASQPVKRGSLTPPVDVMKYSIPSPDLIAKGKDLYTTNCVSCHGENGTGNGPAGATLNPPPRNFVNPQAWRHGPKIANMYVTLQEGIPNTGMASFSNISPEDRFAIIHYIRTFNPTFPKDSPDSLEVLDKTYSLATGVKSPNQIPLPLAMELEVLNSDTLTADLEGIAYNIAHNSDTTATILKGIFLDEKKALNSLAANLKWNESPEEFVKFIETEPVDKGFKATVYQLTSDETNKLYLYLKNLYVRSRV